MLAADPIAGGLRREARDHYLASLYAPDARRAAVQALYAFDLEVARIPHQVSDAAMGEIRLQWWLDTLDAMAAGAAQDHPVAQALAPVLGAAPLPQAALHGMVLARRDQLYADPLPDMAALEAHLGHTTSALIQMVALTLAGPEAAAATETAGLAGVALGLARLLADLPAQRGHGFALIPEDLLRQHGLVRPALGQGNEGPLIAALAAHAEARLSQARIAHAAVPSAARPAFLPVAVAPLWLSRIRRLGPAAFTRPPVLNPFTRQWAIWRAARRNIF